MRSNKRGGLPFLYVTFYPGSENKHLSPPTLELDRRQRIASPHTAACDIWNGGFQGLGFHAFFNLAPLLFWVYCTHCVKHPSCWAESRVECIYPFPTEHDACVARFSLLGREAFDPCISSVRHTFYHYSRSQQPISSPGICRSLGTSTWQRGTSEVISSRHLRWAQACARDQPRDETQCGLTHRARQGKFIPRLSFLTDDRCSLSLLSQ